MPNDSKKMKAIVIGVSAGGLKALKYFCRNIRSDFSVPIVVAQHIHSAADGFLAWHLETISSVKVKEVEDKEELNNGTIYLSPGNYHAMIDDSNTISLSTNEPGQSNGSSTDILFESASEVFKENLVAVILTGANDDGAMGMYCVKQNGGITIVEDPKTAEIPTMPQSVLQQVQVNHVLSLEEIPTFLNNYENLNSETGN